MLYRFKLCHRVGGKVAFGHGSLDELEALQGKEVRLGVGGIDVVAVAVDVAVFQIEHLGVGRRRRR